MSSKNLEEFTFLPLGGSEQFGANLNIYGYGEKLLIVDCGIGFADDRLPGIDVILPDPSYLEKRKKDIVGMIITHAHEDHVGAVSYLWPRLKCPVYCSEFTASVLRKKCEENPECKDIKIKIVGSGETVELEPFRAEFVPVSHSIPDTHSILIETDAGRVLHTGDWNLDEAPVIGEKTNEDTFRKIGDEGLLAYIGDSTNAEVKKRTGSETQAAKGLEKTFKTCKKRIVVTLFSSNIARIKSIIEAAGNCGRRVAVLGWSLHKMIDSAIECGYLDEKTDLIDEEDINSIKRDKILILATGSQGEHRAQLSKISRGMHKNLQLEKGDTVIYSARPIPGNEKDIIYVKNNLANMGVNIISARDTEEIIHVSGHPAREEISTMLGWLRPEIAIPVHGEATMLKAHAELAKKNGVKQVIVPQNGSLIKLHPGKPGIIDNVETGFLAVEPNRIIPVNHPAIRGRKKLQYSGAVHISLLVSDRGDLVEDPLLTTIGLIDEDSMEGESMEKDIIYEIEDVMIDLSRDARYSDKVIAEQVRHAIRKHLYAVLGFKPETTVHVIRL